MGVPDLFLWVGLWKPQGWSVICLGFSYLFICLYALVGFDAPWFALVYFDFLDVSWLALVSLGWLWCFMCFFVSSLLAHLAQEMLQLRSAHVCSAWRCVAFSHQTWIFGLCTTGGGWELRNHCLWRHLAIGCGVQCEAHSHPARVAGSAVDSKLVLVEGNKADKHKLLWAQSAERAYALGLFQGFQPNAHEPHRYLRN